MERRWSLQWSSLGRVGSSGAPKRVIRTWHQGGLRFLGLRPIIVQERPRFSLVNRPNPPIVPVTREIRSSKLLPRSAAALRSRFYDSKANYCGSVRVPIASADKSLL
jgi:hypothetical protein